MDRKSRRYPIVKPSAVVEWSLAGRDRSALQKAVAEKWLQESPYTNYRYNVEQCADGRWVYLRRPTWLNKGFDFQVNVEGFRSVTRTPKGQTKEMPSHPDILNDLRYKLQAHPNLSGALFDAVCHTYDCAEPLDILARNRAVAGIDAGLPPDQLLYIIKWLFIEQDLTYWLQTGRDKLMRAIESDVFGLRG
jgi:hypothetical protein